ncbi:BTB/POZ domain-containing protein dot3 [Ancistrocladus abbreviatus]
MDTIQRIVEFFLMHEEQQQQRITNLHVTKILDNYPAEIAKDPSLSITKFQALAEALPEKVRVCHDSLYRAIDTYLKKDVQDNELPEEAVT